ncbi:MAG TPA: HD domain-containing protein [Rhodothermales bacterium]|nr:HD domain-containing protein [Rhodothermales bacterium]
MLLFSPLIEHAIELSAQWHDGTYRKNRWRDSAFEVPEGEVLRVPTMAHVTAVAMTVQRAGWEDEVVAAAFLHDVLEDANRYEERFRREQMIELVGEAVTVLVDAVSEQKHDAEGNFRSWRDRKEDYVANLRTAPTGAVAISLSDKLHNLWSMNESLAREMDIFSHAPNRRALSAGPEQQLWFNEAVLAVSEQHDDERLVPMRAALREQIDVFASLNRMR